MKWIMCALAADKPSERYNNKNSEDEHKQKNIHNENEKNIETIKETKSRGLESFNEFSLFLVIFSLSPSLTPARFNSKSAIEFQIVCVCVLFRNLHIQWPLIMPLAYLYNCLLAAIHFSWTIITLLLLLPASFLHSVLRSVCSLALPLLAHCWLFVHGFCCQSYFDIPSTKYKLHLTCCKR